MKLALFSVLLVGSSALQFSSSFTGQSLRSNVGSSSARIKMEYIPSGISKEQWKKMKEAEKAKKKVSFCVNVLTEKSPHRAREPDTLFVCMYSLKSEPRQSGNHVIPVSLFR